MLFIPWLARRFGLVVFLVAAVPSVGVAAPVFSDFSFGSGSPFGGSVALHDVDVMLVTTNTQPFGPTAFRDLTDTNPANVTFTFTRAISAFYLEVSRVHPDELITNFNIGVPLSLSGTLVNLGGNITTSGTNDFGFGQLGWTGLNTTVVSFTISNVPGSTVAPALAVNRFGIHAPSSAAVSSAGPAWLLAVGALSAVVRSGRRRQNTSTQISRC